MNKASKVISERDVNDMRFLRFYPSELFVDGVDEDMDGLDFFTGSKDDIADRFVAVILANCVDELAIEDQEKKNNIKFRVADKNGACHWVFTFARNVSATGITKFVVRLTYVTKKKNTHIQKQTFHKYESAHQNRFYDKIHQQIKHVF
ncbi:hypothetical protein MADA3029_740053 [Vibrio nigripulchritudo MADA3029]|uniref:hypothetical protein n=1 Tax=Vibrio nigripulchritudo TaxID=28173 RepID=UPI0003B1B558|nr:hypothetical protein [Vibrio nigripulchritudo]CCN46008.1 hypothetical protein VIBNIMADA3020_1180038 [Vibrio nigripulchritudo MADA3020]CCN54132.1 hypothetical protein VIBNIMADA3021_510055 [Vibrio nigripulchritudo MADA3021]CCN61202.1 hypothetical protein MADA3029_740053 [Vibrio nigripulchritudo MADA3029]